MPPEKKNTAEDVETRSLSGLTLNNILTDVESYVVKLWIRQERLRNGTNRPGGTVGEEIEERAQKYN